MIKRFFNLLDPLLRYVIDHPYKVLILSFFAAALSLAMARNLRIDNDIAKLIPQDYPSVQALYKLRDQVGSESELAVAIKSPSFEANLHFADTLIIEAMQLQMPDEETYWFSRFEYRKNVEFLKDNGLYFATQEELDKLEDYLIDEIADAKQEANPFFFELEDEDETNQDSIAEELNDIYNELIGSEYELSEDSTILVIKFYANGSQTDLEFVSNVYEELQTLVDSLGPYRFHSDMEITLAGRLIRTLIEIETITEDVTESFGAGVLMLLMVVVIYFLYKSYHISTGNHFNKKVLFNELIRAPSIAFIIGIPLILSLCWTFGAAYLFIGNLNIMTSTLGLLLFGMGLDFGIHLFARYSEERGKGYSVEEAIKISFTATGEAVLVVGITTSAAFYILMIGEFKGFSEFGMIAGTGIIFSILSYLIFLPALLVIFDRSGFINMNVLPEARLANNKTPNNNRIKRMAPVILITGLVLTLYSVFVLKDLEFEYDFGKLEPEYERYHELNSSVRQAYSDRKNRNPAYIITDHPDQAIKVAEILRERVESDSLSPTVDRIELFQDRYSQNTEWASSKLKRITKIRSLLNDPFLENRDDEQLQKLRRASSTLSPIPITSVPDFIKKPFTSNNGEIGNLVIIYPSVGLSDGKNSINFADDVGVVSLGPSSSFYAASTSIVASDMLQLMISEAPYMVILTISVVIIFKLIILGKIRWVILALLPLLFSFLWLFGWMSIMNWKLNFYNLVVLPTILGIGDDSGIHMVHRYLEEGKGSIGAVLRSTGEHISISALTTSVGFGGLLFSIHPGMSSIGEMAISGILLTLLAALLLLPALLVVWEQFDGKPRRK
ncbi:RND family transporter [Balneola sp. MJW-20]|uniref:efflux RND transporter permease subunit n=1 Tax=Gracilimonas aurantiaca TaxID=3234185 RepID=UPI003465900B